MNSTSVPAHLLPWLTCTTYMMARLQSKAGTAELQILQQTWELASDWDKAHLALQSELVLHRDILVGVGAHRCWFGRTILPKFTYDAHHALFTRLNHEPLGNLIFHNQDIQRLGLDYYIIEEKSCEYGWLPGDITIQSPLWARCSIFQVKEAEKFYLIEILLPDLEHYCEK